MKKIMATLLALMMVFSLAACGSSSEKSDGSKDKDSTTKAAAKSVTGGLITAEIPDGWRLVTGEEACGDSNFDFIYCSEERGTKYFTVLRDTHDVEHYKEMIATGNYGKDLGTADIGEGTWCLAGKVAAGPVGDATCVIQAYDVDLSDPEVQTVLASIKWVK